MAGKKLHYRPLDPGHGPGTGIPCGALRRAGAPCTTDNVELVRCKSCIRWLREMGLVPNGVRIVVEVSEEAPGEFLACAEMRRAGHDTIISDGWGSRERVAVAVALRRLRSCFDVRDTPNRGDDSEQGGE